ncbi:MAG TPA: dockerin type I domain-containing protein, partial [Thermoanaerobaculia bacterium]|nr:dockerin type I domain-containing protein [Thermoanaerobaculia bacterium]
DTQSGTLPNGYRYVSQQFDANGDNIIDPSDIFYLVNYLFLSGPPPAGAAGLDSGDANGDGVVDPADIFYVVNYLFLSGPAPAAVTPPKLTETSATSFEGSLVLGEPVLRGRTYVIPVIVSAAPGSEVPQALSLRLVFSGDAPKSAVIRRAGTARELEPAFEISRSTPDSLAYLLSFDPRKGFAFASGQRSGVIAEIEVEAARPGAKTSIGIDPALSMLVNAGGTRSATVAGGTLQLQGRSIEAPSVDLPKKERE